MDTYQQIIKLIREATEELANDNAAYDKKQEEKKQADSDSKEKTND